MSISRIKTWSDGQVLTAADLNAEFDNILNNASALISPMTAALSMNFFRLNNVRLDGQTAYTISTTNNVGRIAFNTVDAVVVVSQNSTGPFVPIGPQTNQPTRVSGLIGSMISNVGSFQALGYTMRTSMGLMFGVSATSSFSVNTQTAGPTANGRDQVGAFASTAVHFYAISTGVGSTAPQGVVSSVAPPTGPTLPTGYTGWSYLASVTYTPGTSVVRNTGLVGGSKTYLDINTTEGTLGASLVPVAVYTSTPVNAGVIIPTIATGMDIRIDTMVGKTASTGGLLDVSCTITPTSSAAIIQQQRILANAVSTVAGQTYQAANTICPFPVMTNPPVVYYQLGVNTGTSATVDLLVHSYTVPNGDVG